MNDALVRKHIEFRGRVQGVGFRYRAKHAADMYGASGWVMNNPDGTVSMEVQGSEEQIDKVIIAIEQGSYVRIEKMAVTDMPVVDGEKAFGYRY